MIETATPKTFNFKRHVERYMETSYIEGPTGYIVWRVGTGGNTELLHLYAYPSRKNHGKSLLKRMLKELVKDPPYSTVYGFCLASNTEAKKFYEAVGFDVSFVKGVYREGGAYLFSQEYSKLKEMHGVS